MRKALKRAGAVASVMVATMAVGVGSAFAQAVDFDPTGGAAEDFLSKTGTWIKDHGIPMLVGLFLIGAVVTLLIKLGKRGTKAA